MRKLLLVGLMASVAAAGGVALDTSQRLEFLNCPAAGGDGGVLHAGALLGGSYLMRVTDETAAICLHEYASSNPTGCSDAGVCWSCSDGGGERFPAGTVMLLAVPGGGLGLSCRSAGATGDIVFTRTN